MKKIWFPLTFLMLLMTIVTAQPTTTIYSFPEGYTIVPSETNQLKINDDFQYNFFVYNQSNGMLLTNETLNCTFFLANSTGEIMYSGSVPYYSDGRWGIDISGSNFSQTGMYAHGTKCIGDGSGGTTTGQLEVTRLGFVPTTSQSISSLSYLAIMIFLMVFFGVLGLKLSTSDYLWVIGIFFMFLSVVFLVYNTWLGYEYHLLLTGLPNSQTPEIIFYTFMTLLLAGILVSLGLLFLHWKKVLKYVKNEVKRPEDNYEDVEEWEVDEWKVGRNKFSGGGFTPPNY